MYKKGQATIEFLLTYGWAILIIIAAVLTLVYFVILSPDISPTNKCDIRHEIMCAAQYSGTKVEMTIMNEEVFDMEGISVTVNGPKCSATDATSSPELMVDQTATYSVTCVPESGEFKGNITFTYTNKETGTSHSEVGELLLQIP